MQKRLNRHFRQQVRLTVSTCLYARRLQCTFLQIVGSDSKLCIIIAPNLVPRAFSSLKMADRRNPGQGYCHVTHDEMAFSEIVSSVLRPCFVFLQSETIV